MVVNVETKINTLLIYLLSLVLLDCGSTTYGPEERTQSRISSAYAALEAFRLDVRRFPSAAEGLEVLVKAEGISAWDGPYTEQLFLTDGWGKSLYYTFRDQERRPMVYSAGENGRDDLGRNDDVLCGSLCEDNESQ